MNAVVECVCSAALIVAGAQVSIPLPPSLSSLPVTGQSLASALVGLVFEGTGTAGAALYVLLAALGAPVLAAGRGRGMDRTSCGYVIGFAVCSLVTSTLYRTCLRGRRVLAAAVGQSMVLGCGWTGLVLSGLSARKAWAHGVAPFIPGLLVKSFLVGVVVDVLHMAGYKRLGQ